MKTTSMTEAVMMGVRAWILEGGNIERQELRVLQEQISALAKLTGQTYEQVLDAAMAAAQARKAA